LHAYRSIESEVSTGEAFGVVGGPFGESETKDLADKSGIIIGRTNPPVVNEGDALFHIAKSEHLRLEQTIDEITAQP